MDIHYAMADRILFFILNKMSCNLAYSPTANSPAALLLGATRWPVWILFLLGKTATSMFFKSSRPPIVPGTQSASALYYSAPKGILCAEYADGHFFCLLERVAKMPNFEASFRPPMTRAKKAKPTAANPPFWKRITPGEWVAIALAILGMAAAAYVALPSYRADKRQNEQYEAEQAAKKASFPCPDCQEFPVQFVQGTLYALITRLEDLQNKDGLECYGRRYIGQGAIFLILRIWPMPFGCRRLPSDRSEALCLRSFTAPNPTPPIAISAAILPF
jgi:hypothetical protein